jgi:hypothetical protein
VKAPTIYIVIRSDRDIPTTSPIGWSFDENEARAKARELNVDNEFGPYIVEEVEPLGGRIESKRW